MDDSSDTLIPSDDTEQQEYIQDPDPYNVQPMILATKDFQEDSPSLMELAFDSEPLKIIAKNFHKLMQEEGDFKYGLKTRQELEKVVAVFVHQSSLIAVQNATPLVLPRTKQNEPKKASTVRVENNEFKKLTKELVIAQEKIRELTHKNTVSEEIQQEYRKEIANLSKENDTLFHEKNDLVQQLNQLRKETDAKEAKLKADIDEIKDQDNYHKDKCNQSDYEAERLRKQLSSFADELGQKNAELNALKAKLNAKNMKVKEYRRTSQQDKLKLHEIETLNEQLTLQINDLERMYNDYVKEFNEEEIRNSAIENSRLTSALEMVMQQVHDNAEELAKAEELKKKYTAIIRKQMDLIQAYDNQMKDMKHEETEEEVKIIFKERDLEEPIKIQEVTTKTNNSPYFDSIYGILKTHFKDIQPEDAIKVVQGLLNGNTDSPLAAMNKRLFNIIENQFDFISNMASNGEMKYLLLSSDERDDALMDQDYIRNQILVEAARCKTFVSMNNLVIDEEPNATFTKEDLDEFNDSSDLQQREIFDLIAVQTQNANLMRIFGENLVDIKQKCEEELAKAAEIVNCEGGIEEICPIIVEKLRAYRAVAKRLNDVTNEINFNNYDESLKSIETICKHDHAIRNLVDGELRDATGFSGTDIEVVPYSAKYIADVLKEINEITSYKPKELIAHIEELKKSLENEKEVNTKAIEKLEIELDDKKVENSELLTQNGIYADKIKNLTNELNGVKNKNNDCNTKLEMLSQTIQQLDEELKRLRNENEEVNNKLDAKEESCQKRIDSMLENERKRHSQEVSDQKKRFNEKETALKEEIANRSNKMKELKNKFREALSAYETVVKKQKETINSVRAQNQDLVGRCSRTQKKNKKSENATGSIKSLEAENSVLQIRIKQLNERFEKMQTEKDVYWQSQMEIREIDLDSKYQEQISEIKKEHKDFLLQASNLLKQNATSNSGFLTILESFVNDLENANKRVELANKRIELMTKNNEDESKNIPKVVKLLKSLQTWEKWANEIYGNSTGLDPKQCNAPELRAKLGEMILASISSKKITNDLESLRVQKAALLRGVGQVESESDLSLRSLINAVSFIDRMYSIKRKASNPNCMKKRNVLRN